MLFSGLKKSMRKTMSLTIDMRLKKRFPEIKVPVCEIRGVMVEKLNTMPEKFKEELMEQVRERYDLESLKDEPILRAYRDFFWRVGIDPTKNRPAAEALIRRILQGKNMPSINTLVDSYNLASIKTEIALAAFDAEKLKGDLLMRFATEGEEFFGIGMEKPMRLQGIEIVVSDVEKLVAVYPHRDADGTKVTEETKNVLLLVCGVPGIREEALLDATCVAIEYVTKFCGGEARMV